MTKTCRVCKKSTIKHRKDCEDCWKFYDRAQQKFNEKRNIDIHFNDPVDLAKHLKKLYDDNPHCSYTGLEMMVENRQYVAQLKAEKNFEELEEYKRKLAVLSFSVDREISIFGSEKAPYSKDNIVLCIRALNTMKGEFEPDAFIQACYQVLAYQVEKQTIFADTVISMLRSFNAKHIDKPIIPKNEEILKQAGYYEEDFEQYRKEYAKQTKAKHKRKN
ncbi:TPA: hypothetical protein ROY24_004473 [Bacillus cereus]|nr:hypothetical protein CN338_06715 [Bacillus cereus]HDX9671347.1 hypothetical protein [Bacillus cereus]